MSDQSSYQGIVTYWSAVSGFGIVRSAQVDGMMIIYRDSFSDTLDEVNLCRRLVRFKHEDISGDNLTKFELIPSRERTWSERVQYPDVKKDDSKEHADPDLDSIHEKGQTRKSEDTHTTLSKEDCSAKSEALCLLNLPPYYFKGVIVTIKKTEGFLFIRSAQVTGDVFVQIEKLSRLGGSENNLLGKIVLFTVRDSGKKSLEALDVKLVEETVPPSVVMGSIIDWDFGLGEGRLELEPHAIRIKFERAKLEVSRRNQTKAMVGRKVFVELMVDRNLGVEVKNIKLIKTSTAPYSENKKRPGIDPGVLRNIPTMDMNALSTIFDKHLKSSPISLIIEQDIASIVLAILKRESELSGQTVIQDKVARVISSKVSTLVNTVVGCELLISCVKIFSVENKRLLVEQLESIFDNPDQLFQSWQSAPNLFITTLPYMEEEFMTSIANSLSGQYFSFATSIRYASTLSSFVASIGNTDLVKEAFGEMEENLIDLALDRFGHLTVVTLIERGLEDVKEGVVAILSGKVVELSCDAYGHVVILSCIKNTSDQYQQVLIENICKASDKTAETHMVTLVGDKYGHKVVLAMLEVSRHRQIHNTIKTSILVKQEEVMDTDFGRVVIDIMRTNFRGTT